MPPPQLEVWAEAQTIEALSEVGMSDKERRYFADNSWWWKFRKGPFFTGLYATATFPRVFFNYHVRRKRLHPRWTAREEASIRTIKWAMNAPLATCRGSAGTLEFLFKTFRCPEPLKKIRDAPGVQGYWIGPETWKGRQAEAIIFYIHGGGYVASTSLWGIPPLCYMLKTLRKKHNIHARAISIDYPLAPESIYPCAVNSAERAYRWLVNESGMPGSQKVFIAGDSAGGGLGLSLLQRIYSNPDTLRPIGAIFFSPWVDLSCTSVSFRTNAKYDFLPADHTPLAAEYYVYGLEKTPITKEKLRESAPLDKKNKRQVLAWLDQVENSAISTGSGGDSATRKRGHEQRLPGQRTKPKFIKLQKPFNSQQRDAKPFVNSFKDPMVSPVNTPDNVLSQFPPMFISYGGKEIFKDDIVRFIRRAQRAKGKVNAEKGESVDASNITVVFDEDMVHVHPILLDVFGARSRHALKEVCKFVDLQFQARTVVPQTLATKDLPLSDMPIFPSPLYVSASLPPTPLPSPPSPPPSLHMPTSPPPPPSSPSSSQTHTVKRSLSLLLPAMLVTRSAPASTAAPRSSTLSVLGTRKQFLQVLHSRPKSACVVAEKVPNASALLLRHARNSLPNSRRVPKVVPEV